MNNLTVNPFGSNILVKPIEKKRVLVSDQASLCEYGKVVAVGGDVRYIKVGDVVGYTVWGLKHLEVGNDRFYFVPENSDFILGTVNGLTE